MSNNINVNAGTLGFAREDLHAAVASAWCSMSTTVRAYVPTNPHMTDADLRPREVEERREEEDKIMGMMKSYCYSIRRPSSPSYIIDGNIHAPLNVPRHAFPAVPGLVNIEFLCSSAAVLRD